MKRMRNHVLFVVAFCTMPITAMTAATEENAWKNSYQLEATGKYLEAISAIDQTASTGFDAELKLLRRGWLYYLLGSYNESIREYRLATERNKYSVDAHLGMTLPLLALKRWREAEQNARAALALSSNNYTALLRLIIALEGQRDWVNMQKNAIVMISLYPSDASAFVYLARSYAWLNKKKEAVTAYTAVLSRYPGHLEAKAYLEKN